MAQILEKCVIYARVSSKEQEETGYSLPAQEKMLKEYAARMGFQVSKVFAVAESASGTKQREVFQEMMAYVTEKRVSHILTEKVDRLTRNMKEAVEVNEWMERDEARRIHFAKQNLIIHKNAKSDEKFRWDIEIVLAKKYTANLSEEVRKGQKEKIEQGWLPTKPPIGYRTMGEKGHKIHVVDETKARYVRDAYESYATGRYSLSALRDKLYADGLRTRTGAKLAKGRLAEILSDPFYYGAMRWKDITYRAKQEPLVSQELWDKVQFVMHGRGAPHYKRHLFRFTKRLKCGECGGTISGEIQKGHTYYSCKHTKTCSQRGATREEDIEMQLMGVFRFFESLTPAEAEAIYAKIRADHSGEAAYKEQTITELQARYKALQRQLDVLYEDRLAERISTEFWETKQESINEEREVIQARLERMRSSETRYFELYINILDLARRAREIYERATPEQRRALLAQIFSNLTLRDRKVTYSLTKPVALLAARVQERLDVAEKFEPSKGGSTKAQKSAAAPENTALLPG